MIRSRTRLLFVLAVGFVATALLIALYLAIITIGGATDPLALAWERRMSVLPLAAGFGIQAGLYAVLRGLHRTPLQILTGRATTGISGGMSTVGMVACCLASLPNLLLLLGITALTPFVAQWSTPLMMAGFAVNLVGIGVMVYNLLRQNKRVAALNRQPAPAEVS